MPLAAAPEPPLRRHTLQTAGLAAAAYVAFNLLLPFVPLPHHRLALGIIVALVLSSTLAFMLLQLWLAQAVAKTRPRPLLCGGAALVCALLWVLFARLAAPYGPHPPVLLTFALGFAVTLGCTFLGILLSRIIREPNVLLPVAIVAMPIDFLGAMTPIGFTQHMVAKHPDFVKHVSVPVPGVGSATHYGGLAPIGFIGPGDVLFVAFFFAVVLRLHMNVRGTFWWIYGLLTATMLFVLSPWGFNIAALVPMGAAVLIANFRYFKLRREEVFATLYAGLLIIALVTGFYFYVHSRFVKSDAEGTTDAKPTLVKPPAASRNPAPGRPAGN